MKHQAILRNIVTQTPKGAKKAAFVDVQEDSEAANEMNNFIGLSKREMIPSVMVFSTRVNTKRTVMISTILTSDTSSAERPSSGIALNSCSPSFAAFLCESASSWGWRIRARAQRVTYVGITFSSDIKVPSRQGDRLDSYALSLAGKLPMMNGKRDCIIICRIIACTGHVYSSMSTSLSPFLLANSVNNLWKWW